jgi:hypothetical protein
VNDDNNVGNNNDNNNNNNNNNSSIGETHPLIEGGAIMSNPQLVPPRADLIMSRSDGSSVFGVRVADVTIVDVTAPSFQRHQVTGKYRSMSDDLAAATMREDLKKRRYRGVLGKNCPGFLPFVVEATGRLGPLAGKWVNCIKDSQSGAEQCTSRFILTTQLVL